MNILADRKKNAHFGCPRGWRVSLGIMGDELRVPLKPTPNMYNNAGLSGEFQGSP